MIFNHLICFQAFEAQPLNPATDFTGADETGVRLIAGHGQMIYWKGCNVSVIEKDSEGEEKATPLHGMSDGQGVVGVGIKLYITYGKVKQIEVVQ